MLAKKRFVTLAVLSVLISLAGCGRPGAEVTRPPEPPPSPAPAATPAQAFPTPSPLAAEIPPPVSPKPLPPEPTPPKPTPSPSPTVDIAQMKRRLASDMRQVFEAATGFAAGKYRLLGPTPGQQSSNVTWKSAQNVEFSFAGEIYFFSLPADYVDSAQKRVATAYALTAEGSATGKTVSSNLSDEAVIRGVVAELQKAISEYQRQASVSYIYEMGMSETVKKWDKAPQTGRAITEADKDSAVRGLKEWYASYRKQLADLVSKLNGVVSYAKVVADRTVSG